MSIEVRQVTKSFGRFTALDNVSLTVPTGQLVALLGPSGCGKTTLLRIMAGLETPVSGSILFHGEETTNTPVRERRVGFVFQHYALFRHLTIFENVAFGLRVLPRKNRPDDTEIHARVIELLHLVQLESVANRYPNQLSGGQRQRVALARSLAVEPKVLLLDEPFGALDARVRKELRRWLRRLQETLHITSVFVTHDQEEALEVADQVVVMNEGKIEQVGTPQEVYDHPATPFVYHFLGNVNVFHGRVQDGTARVGGVELEPPSHGPLPDGPAIGYARSYEIDLDVNPLEVGAIEAVVSRIQIIGPLVRLELQRKDTGAALEVELSRDRHELLGIVVGTIVFARPKTIRVFSDSKSFPVRQKDSM
ncbi:MAG TPA: sulfate ABC transporter ATP-binding protein [Nitrospira sp.]|nr:sulfate ABC transporter ATP-binding protein [Nitrospira sp.]